MNRDSAESLLLSVPVWNTYVSINNFSLQNVDLTEICFDFALLISYFHRNEYKLLSSSRHNPPKWMSPETPSYSLIIKLFSTQTWCLQLLELSYISFNSEEELGVVNSELSVTLVTRISMIPTTVLSLIVLFSHILCAKSGPLACLQHHGKLFYCCLTT